MKKKHWLFPTVCIALAVVVCAAIVLFASQRSLSVSVGRCLVADNGSCMLIADSSPIVLSDRSKSGDSFSGLSTGDQILVIHDGIQETYPARTGAYFCLRLGGGSLDDVPGEVIDQLIQLGWLTP